VGLVFYQILTLEHPLTKHLSHTDDFDRWREVHLTILCDDVRDKRTDVPAPLARLLLRMVEKWAGNRPEWDEVIKGLSPVFTPVPSISIDPRALAAMSGHVEQHAREQHSKTAAELKREQEAEREAARRGEYAESAKRLLSRFDGIIEEYNQQDTGYQIGAKGEGTLSRQYTLMNGRTLACEIFRYNPVEGAYGRILGGGYLGVDGGLSINLVLFGMPEDVATGRWAAAQVTVSGVVIGAEAKWYQVAGVSRETVSFLEYERGEEPWRRDFASYFGFSNAEAFYEHYGTRGMGPYNFTIPSGDIIQAFNEILTLGIRIPSRR
jgi:hypothetical protein